MPIPQFDDQGLLPPGIHEATLDEIQAVMCWNDHRRDLWQSFLRFIDVEYRGNGLTMPLLVDGSFCRAKPIPSDVDVVMDLTGAASDLAIQVAMALRFQHAKIKNSYRVDLHAHHPSFPHDITAFFRYIGDKCAMELALDVKHPKGIVRTCP